MRNHLSLKQIASCLGVKETYAGQAFDPALNKIVEVYLEYQDEMLLMILEAAKERRGQKALEDAKEVAAREAMANGRIDRRRLHPTAMPTEPTLFR